MDLNERVGDFFTLREAVRSELATRRGISNLPTPEAHQAIRWVAKHLGDPLRRQFGPIRVSSWYRSQAVNDLLSDGPDGSSNTSAHLWGGAIDFEPVDSSISLAEVVLWVAGADLDFDQVIYEYGDWVHIGASKGSVFGKGRASRGEVLMKFKGTRYLPFNPRDARVS